MYITKDNDKENEILKGSPHFDHSDNHLRYEKHNKLNNNYLQRNKVCIISKLQCIYRHFVSVVKKAHI